MRTEKEVKKAIDIIKKNSNLTNGYSEDVEVILEWVLGGEPFDGLDGD